MLQCFSGVAGGLSEFNSANMTIAVLTILMHDRSRRGLRSEWFLSGAWVGSWAGKFDKAMCVERATFVCSGWSGETDYF